MCDKRLLRSTLSMCVLVVGSLAAEKTFIHFPSLVEDRLPSHRRQESDSWHVMTTYEQSTQARALGGYFGPMGKSDFWLGRTIEDDAHPSNVPHANLTLHQSESIQLSLRPQRRMESILLERSLVNDRGHWCLKAGINVQHVWQTLRPSFQAKAAEGLPQIETLKNYLFGSYEVASDPAAVQFEAQEALRYLRFYDGWQGIAGVDSVVLSLSKEFDVGVQRKFSLWTEYLLPAHKQKEYTYLFQPDFKTQTVVARWGANAGYQGNLLSGVTSTVTLLGSVGYHLPFVQKRTFGVYDRSWSPFQLLGRGSIDVDFQQAVPAANVLTLNCKVEQGFCATVAAQWAIDLYDVARVAINYTFYAQSAERLTPRSSPFESENYGFLAGENPGDPGNPANFDSLGRPLLKGTDIDATSAAQPGMCGQSLQLVLGGQVAKESGKQLRWQIGGSYHYVGDFQAQTHMRFFADLQIYY